MSYDIFFMDLPADARTIADVPTGWTAGSLGGVTEVMGRFAAAMPGIEFSSPGFGSLSGEGWSIDVVANEDPVRAVCLHVRGDTAAMEIVTKLAQGVGLRAVDPQAETGIFEPAAAVQGYRRSQERVEELTGRARSVRSEARPVG